MPTLSLISFDRGGFTLVNHHYSDHLAIDVTRSRADSVHVRPDNEIVIGLNQIQLHMRSIRQTGPTVVDAITRRKLPYPSHDRTRRNDLFVRVGVMVDGATVHYYLAFALDDSGRLRAWVDGWSFEADRADGIAEVLEAQVPRGVDAVQEIADQTLSDVEDLVFTAIYLLPGTGTREPGRHRGDTGVALALIPIMWW